MSEKKKSDNGLTGFILKRVALVLLDAIIMNGSYYLALLIRFYFGGSFRTEKVEELYLPAFQKFWPWYTVLAIIAFALWGLYSRRWKHAGLKEFNRLLAANLCTVVIMVVGTLIFIERMPVTYYVIGAVLQLTLTALVRFAYRFWILEKARLTKQPIKVIVGTGLAANHVISTINTSTPVIVDGKKYSSAEDALVKIGADRVVKELKVTDGMIEIVTEAKPQTMDTSWAGEDISFF